MCEEPSRILGGHDQSRMAASELNSCTGAGLGEWMLAMEDSGQ